MGVKGLFPLLKKHAPSAVRSHPPNYLQGKRISLDGNLLLFRDFMSPLWLPADLESKHAMWCLRLARYCRACNISPIIVFDSPMTTPAKVRERAKRSLARQSVRRVFDTAVDRSHRLTDLTETFSKLIDMEPLQRQQVARSFEAELVGADSSIMEAMLSLKETTVSQTTDLQETIIIPDSVVDDTFAGQPEEVTNMTQSLIGHLDRVVKAGTSTAKAKTELDVLLSFAVTRNSTLPIEGLQQLSIDTTELVEKLSRRIKGPTNTQVSQCQKWLHECFHLPVQQSPDSFEGECTAAFFQKLGYVDLVASDDSDVLIYGVSQLRGFMGLGGNGYDSQSDKKLLKLLPLTEVDVESMMASLDLTADSLVDFAILSGTDYTINIRGMGPQKVLDLIRKYGNLSDTLAALETIHFSSGARKGSIKYKVHESFADDALVARNIFSSFPNITQLAPHFQSSEIFLKSTEEWKNLCRDDTAWQMAEEEVLSRCPDLSKMSLSLLDDKGLYMPNANHVGRLI
ncbi:PIN domain-like protein [Protomyces lactucae-debilis]|uniref:PIN domain-like protein n=1 Tax=Protomyces lactucae-debilis TaxID=2754530 RepID=A0A1Y2F0I7_PROLT|nr:PIN domain-like protein [Protomyces lactucae-debilis]ORY77004.1 PIN domain-like protein [Protomyces lactucae-debilis]